MRSHAKKNTIPHANKGTTSLHHVDLASLLLSNIVAMQILQTLKFV